MIKYQEQVKEFMSLIGQDCPDKPVIPSDKDLILRARVILEETLEYINASGVSFSLLIDDISVDIKDISSLDFQKTHETDIVEVADAIGDIGYINYGSANCFGLDMEEIEDEIHANNMTKIKTGYKDENGKFRKGTDYVPIDLRPIIFKQLEGNE